MSLAVGVIIVVAALIGLFGYSALIVGARVDGDRDEFQDNESERNEKQ